MASASHTLDIYGVDLHLATTKKSWKKLRKRVGFIEEEIPTSLGLTHFAIWEPDDGGRKVPVIVFWIWKPLNEDPAQLIETCAHEAAHAATHLMGWLEHDIRGDDGHEEPTSYLIGWLTRWLWTNATTNDGGTR